jgi:hypothetical protein
MKRKETTDRTSNAVDNDWVNEEAPRLITYDTIVSGFTIAECEAEKCESRYMREIKRFAQTKTNEIEYRIITKFFLNVSHLRNEKIRNDRNHMGDRWLRYV